MDQGMDVLRRTWTQPRRVFGIFIDQFFSYIVREDQVQPPYRTIRSYYLQFDQRLHNYIKHNNYA